MTAAGRGLHEQQAEAGHGEPWGPRGTAARARRSPPLPPCRRQGPAGRALLARSPPPAFPLCTQPLGCHPPAGGARRLAHPLSPREAPPTPGGSSAPGGTSAAALGPRSAERRPGPLLRTEPRRAQSAQPAPRPPRTPRAATRPPRGAPCPGRSGPGALGLPPQGSRRPQRPPGVPRPAERPLPPRPRPGPAPPAAGGSRRGRCPGPGGGGAPGAAPRRPRQAPGPARRHRACAGGAGGRNPPRRRRRDVTARPRPARAAAAQGPVASSRTRGPGAAGGRAAAPRAAGARSSPAPEGAGGAAQLRACRALPERRARLLLGCAAGSGPAAPPLRPRAVSPGDAFRAQPFAARFLCRRCCGSPMRVFKTDVHRVAAPWLAGFL